MICEIEDLNPKAGVLLAQTRQAPSFRSQDLWTHLWQNDLESRKLISTFRTLLFSCSQSRKNLISKVGSCSLPYCDRDSQNPHSKAHRHYALEERIAIKEMCSCEVVAAVVIMMRLNTDIGFALGGIPNRLAHNAICLVYV